MLQDLKKIKEKDRIEGLECIKALKTLRVLQSTPDCFIFSYVGENKAMLRLANWIHSDEIFFRASTEKGVTIVVIALRGVVAFDACDVTDFGKTYKKLKLNSFSYLD